MMAPLSNSAGGFLFSIKEIIKDIKDKKITMNLQELCRSLGEMAKAQELVQFSAAGASLAEINPLQVNYYPLFFIIPSGTHMVKDDTTRYDLTLYYIDRLLEVDNTLKTLNQKLD